MYIYSDTDSIKTTLPIEDIKKFCDIDDTKLGKWKYERYSYKRKIYKTKNLYFKI